jgi:uncharacterized protein YndB with AHSA1/START domain
MGDDRPQTAAGLGARTVRFERRLEASIERAYRAFADPEELGRWLAPRIDGGLNPGARTILVWPHVRVWWDVLEARPSTRFVFRRAWDPEERIVTTSVISISKVGYGSLVEVEDGPYLLDEPAGLDAWAGSIAWWTETLVSLRAWLDFSVAVREAR